MFLDLVFHMVAKRRCIYIYKSFDGYLHVPSLLFALLTSFIHFHTSHLFVIVINDVIIVVIVITDVILIVVVIIVVFINVVIIVTVAVKIGSLQIRVMRVAFLFFSGWS